MSNSLGKALFVDRDGILNHIVVRDGQVHSPRNESELIRYPEMAGLKELKGSGFTVVMVTNQPDIERGIVSEEFIKNIHADFKIEFGLDAIYCCPHASNSHPDKKPNPGMFLRAAADLALDLSKSFHLGDTERDTLAARNCGVKSILWSRPYNLDLASDYRVASIDELFAILNAPAK